MQRVIIGMVFFCATVMVTCSPPPYGFVLNRQYTRQDFTGRELSGKTIGMCPLLNSKGLDTSGVLRSADLLKRVRKSRSDLRLIPVGEVEAGFRENWGRDSLNNFYTLLFKGEMLSLQTSDSLWKGIQSNYFLSLRLKSASIVKSFNRSVRKRLSLEAELWDCESMEVVWRVTVNGICLEEKIPDRMFILETIIKAYEELPVTLPAYDSKNW